MLFINQNVYPVIRPMQDKQKKLLNIRREEHKNNFNLKNKKYPNLISKHRTENVGDDENHMILIGTTYKYNIKKITYTNVCLQK